MSEYQTIFNGAKDDMRIAIKVGGDVGAVHDKVYAFDWSAGYSPSATDDGLTPIRRPRSGAIKAFMLYGRKRAEFRICGEDHEGSRVIMGLDTYEFLAEYWGTSIEFMDIDDACTERSLNT